MEGIYVPSLFHAGRGPVEKVADHFFEGWYGWGFYAAFEPNFVRRWYGPVVTKLDVKPEAKVLVASVNYSSAPPGLLEEILANDLKFQLDGDQSKLVEQRERLMENPIQWVHGVDRLAIEYYDIVIYHDENVVVKNPEMVVPVSLVP